MQARVSSPRQCRTSSGILLGLGLAVVKHLVSQSHNVVALARSTDLLDRLQHEHPQQVLALPGDLKEISLAHKAVELATTKFGQLDGVVVNHGALLGVKRLEDCDIDDWRGMFDINFFSAVALVSQQDVLYSA